MIAREDRCLVARLGLLALLACLLTLASGVLVSVTYTSYEPALRATGLTLVRLRPIHDAFALAWMFLGGACAILLHLAGDAGPLDAASRRWVSWMLAVWAVAGGGILVTLLLGRLSGREYLGYHPAFSLLILAGWLLLGRTWIARRGLGLEGQPVYVWMWVIGLGLFAVTYLEGHLYLLDAVSRRPLRDLAIQWKAGGSLVGAFNQIAYGALVWVAARLGDDESYARSRTAFGLFWVGLLNTFTNYGHHTYHLPQSPWVHLIAFAVSMCEIVILGKVLLDVLALGRRRPAAGGPPLVRRFLVLTTLFTFLMLAFAILLSVPPLNTFAHGTHLVVAHSMGSMIGIDSMILWAVVAYAVARIAGDRHAAIGGRSRLAALTLAGVALLGLWLTLVVRGLDVGLVRSLGADAPDLSRLVAVTPAALVVTGSVLAATATWLILGWMAALLPAALGREGDAARP